jgi:stage V sporulation protein G
MEITRVKIFPANEDHLKAYVNITIDDCFLITGLKLIRVSKGYYVEMPRAKRANGEYVDIAAPLNNETRQMLEEKVFAQYEKVTGERVTRQVGRSRSVFQKVGPLLPMRTKSNFDRPRSIEINRYIPTMLVYWVSGLAYSHIRPASA